MNNNYEIDVRCNEIGEEIIFGNRFGEILFQTQFDFSKITKIVKILGLIAIISYMAAILFTWIYANMGGYVYFSAGEPVQSIKYTEWFLGVIGILVAFDYLHKEIVD